TRARAPRAADEARQARPRARSVRVQPPRRPRPSSSRHDVYADVAGYDLADLDRLHAPRCAGALPRCGVGGRHPDEKTARGLRVEDQRSERNLDPLEADLRPVIEIGLVPFEASEADARLGMRARSWEQRHEA